MISPSFRIQNNRDGYIEFAQQVLQHGTRVSSQYGETIEALNATVILENPRDSIPYGINRNFSPALIAAESSMLVGGFIDDDLLVELVPFMGRFREDDGKFWGSYGQRTASQMPVVIEKLRQDPTTRQAVVTVWDQSLDGDGGRRDHPCTLSLQFLIRDDKLILMTTMRSNDIIKGWAHDAGQFTGLQQTVANVLGLECGPYVHNAKSFHIYTSDIPQVEKMQKIYDHDWTTNPSGFGWEGATWQKVQRMARFAVYGESLPEGPEFWYNQQITKKLRGADK